MDPADTSRTFHSTATEDMLFSSTHRTFSRMDHMSDLQNKSEQKFNKAEITPSDFSNHSDIKPETGAQPLATQTILNFRNQKNMDFSDLWM